MAKSAAIRMVGSMSVAKLLMPYLGRHRVLLAVSIAGTVVGALVSFSIGLAIKYVVDGIPTDANEGFRFLNQVLLVAAIVIPLSKLAGFFTNYSLVKVATRITRDLQRDVFSSLIGQKVAYLEQHASGELQTRMLADTGVVGGFSTQQVPGIVAASISVIAGTVGALFISLRLTLIVLAFLPFIFLPILVWGPRLREFGMQIHQRIAEIGKATGEIFRSIKVVHAYGKEAQETARFRQLADAAATTVVRCSRLQLAMTTSVNLMATVALMVLLWAAARGIYSGVWTVGALMSFAYFNGLIVQSVGAFFGFAAALKQTTGAAQRIVEYLAVGKHPWPGLVKPVSSTGAIEFRDVHFRYPARPQVDVLKGVSFVVEPGTNVVIVGPSGAGKSALFELLLGLYGPDAGSILIDGTDYREIGLGELRSAIGYVPQKESLLSGTVFENIAYGTSGAEEAKVVAAAKLACAHEFIVQLPQSYQTDLGEVAARLSGGERQRISLARALIREPRILLLDEDKSALDADSERRVADSVCEWAAARGTTVVSIAHRLSSLNRADRIVVVDGGMVAGYGSHAELLRRCEAYRNLLTNYSGGPSIVALEERAPGVVAAAG
jgi:ATP-binding cassette, subfamily B, bacterial